MSSVFIRGIGVVSSIGNNADEIFGNLLNNQTDFTEESELYGDLEECIYSSRIGSEIIESIDKFLESKSIRDTKEISKIEKILLYTISKAIEDAGININCYERGKIAFVIGNSDGVSEALEQYIEKKSFLSSSSYFILERVIEKLGLTGARVLFVHNACASSNVAVEIGCNLLKAGRADLVISGGVEIFSKRVLFGLRKVGIISQKKCIPFAVNSQGIIIGEGGAVVVLEKKSEKYAKSKKYAEVIATASTNGGISMEKVECDALYNAYLKLFAHGGIQARDLDCIMGHATGSVLNDYSEAKCIQKVKENVPVCVIKNTLGYLLGAAGIMGVVVICKIFQYGIIPGATYARKIESVENINIINENKKDFKTNLWCNNAFGMGGNNTLLLIKKCICKE